MVVYKQDGLYLIRNSVTGQGTYFEVREMLPYMGHKILYGETRSHQTRIFRGIGEWDGKPTCFPVPNFEQTGRVGLAAMACCIRATGGDEGSGRVLGQWLISELGQHDQQSQFVKLGTESPLDEDSVFTFGKWWADVCGGTPWVEGWTGKTVNRDGLIRCARQTMDIYNDVLRLGKLPEWFLHQRRDHFNRMTLTPATA